MENEHLIAEVGGSMAIEGLALTKADRERLRLLLKRPDSFERTVSELVAKYKVRKNRV